MFLFFFCKKMQIERIPKNHLEKHTAHNIVDHIIVYDSFSVIYPMGLNSEVSILSPAGMIAKYTITDC